MELKDKLVLVAGAGISGIGAVGLLKTAGAQVILYDGNAAFSEDVLYEKIHFQEKEKEMDHWHLIALAREESIFIKGVPPSRSTPLNGRPNT